MKNWTRLAVAVVLLALLAAGCGGGGGTISLRQTLENRFLGQLECMESFDRQGYKSYYSENYMAYKSEQSPETQELMEQLGLGNEIDYYELMVLIDVSFDVLHELRQEVEKNGYTLRVEYTLHSLDLINTTGDTALTEVTYSLTVIISGQGEYEEETLSGGTYQISWAKEGGTWRIISEAAASSAATAKKAVSKAMKLLPR